MISYVSGATLQAIDTPNGEAPDGEPFLMLSNGEGEGGNRSNVVLNRFDELDLLAPTQ